MATTDTLEAYPSSNGSFVLRMRCGKCGQLVRCTGLPVIVPYTNDQKVASYSLGLMCARIHPSHTDSCKPEAVRE